MQSMYFIKKLSQQMTKKKKNEYEFVCKERNTLSKQKQNKQYTYTTTTYWLIPFPGYSSDSVCLGGGGGYYTSIISSTNGK
mmetsp:Transcript_45043/g.74294  ORF Transcript_45043/g.74294 Transcript_45043/m.74294 type:complete len:81 (+) Transcript_45043:3-245(+)